MSTRVSNVRLAGVAMALMVVASTAGAQATTRVSTRNAPCPSAYKDSTMRTTTAPATTGSMSNPTYSSTDTTVRVTSDTAKARFAHCRRARNTTRTAGGEVGLTRARSQERIPVSKEVGAGPVRDTMPAPVAAAPDTATPPPPPPPPPARVDTSTYVPPAPAMVVKHYGNWYIGFGAGTAIPTEELRQAYNSGVSMHVPIGWESESSLLGARLNLGYSKFEGRTTFRSTGTTTPGTGSSSSATLPLDAIQLWSALADLTLRLPVFGNSLGGPMNGLYAVAGGGLNEFRDFSFNLQRTNPELVTPDNMDKEAITRWALNAGGGLSVGLGMADVFVESRYVTAFTPNHRTSYVPVVLGLAFRY
ncbi:MAG TPA: hypothetical protein VF929_12425 [Gemmatimonadaceae bacterium]